MTSVITTIDWMSIMRHSRRRFSNYVYSVPGKVRRRRYRHYGATNKNSGATGSHGRQAVKSSDQFSCCCFREKDLKKMAKVSWLWAEKNALNSALGSTILS
ncbi:hypothetical protein M8J77_004371 [Diaphorina citri]|nr:hypothetical protein M8J77_004371 [Diaphorina citri]